jgi:hypothetical protein
VLPESIIMFRIQARTPTLTLTHPGSHPLRLPGT